MHLIPSAVVCLFTKIFTIQKKIIHHGLHDFFSQSTNHCSILNVRIPERVTVAARRYNILVICRTRHIRRLSVPCKIQYSRERKMKKFYSKFRKKMWKKINFTQIDRKYRFRAWKESELCRKIGYPFNIRHCIGNMLFHSVSCYNSLPSQPPADSNIWLTLPVSTVFIATYTFHRTFLSEFVTIFFFLE